MALAKPVRAAVRKAHSSVYWYLRDHHDALVAEFAQVARPNWRGMAEAFAGLGLADHAGKPASPEAIRMTWWRVRRDVAKMRATMPPPEPKRPAAPVVPPRFLHSPAPMPAPPVERPCSPEPAPRSENAGSGQPTGRPLSREEVEAELARFEAGLGGRKKRIPQQVK